MSGLSAALYIGKSSLAAQLYAMQVTGNNIANVDTDGYTRQQLNTTPGSSVSVGTNLILGSGVTVEQVQRVRNELLDLHIRDQNASTGKWETVSSTLSELESIFTETSDATLGDVINEFWNSWYDLSNDPESSVCKSTVMNQGIVLANRFQSMADSMSSMRQNIDSAITTTVDEINTIASSIADLNQKIVEMEAGGEQQANDYRDQRDLLLDELSGYVNISSTEMANGEVSVYIGGSLLVGGSNARELDVSQNAEGFSDVIWADTGSAVTLQDGSLAGYIEARDTIIPKYSDRLDSLASEIIEAVNRVHSQGMGTTLNSSVTASNAVSDPTAALDSAGLSYSPTDGTFTIAVYDSDGAFVEEQTITVDADADSLNDIRDAINAAFVGSGNVSASIDASNRLEITSAGSNTFSFVDSSGNGDSSDLLMALGINTFFSGDDALSIDVNESIVSDPSLISTGTTSEPGDNSIALAIADLSDALVLEGGTATINDYYETTIGTLGVDSLEASQMLENCELVGESYESQREMYSGVSLDEEMTNMLKYQQAYNAAAKFISAVSDLMDVLFETL